MSARCHRAVLLGVAVMLLPACQPSAPSVRDPAQYVGRYRSGCFGHQWLHVGSEDGPPVPVWAEFTVAVAGPSTLQLNLTQHYFDAADVGCAGPERGRETSAIRMDIGARETTVDYHGQTLPAARIDVHYAPPEGLGDGSAAAQVIDGRYYPAGYLTTTRERRYLLMLIGDGMYFGNEERDKDADGYPIHLEDEAGALRF